MTGSGKTSAIRPLMRAILPFVGCVWACVKSDEMENAVNIMTQAGRTPKLLSQHRCNVLAYLLNAPGGSPAEVTRYFERLSQSLNTSKGGDGESSFWANLFTRLMTYAITVIYLAKRDKVTLADLHRFIATAPSSVEEFRSEEYHKTEFAILLRQANDHISTPDEHRQADQAFGFLTKEFPGLGSKAQSAARTQCAGVLSPLLTPPFFDLFCSEDSTITPDDVLNGDCLILDFPVLVWGDGGKLAQNLFLQMTKSALLRRKIPDPPVAFVADEFQLLTSPDFDVNFSTVARSARAIQVSATQSLSVFNALLGGSSLAQEQCRALMNCHATHVVLATNDFPTAKYYSELFGEHRELFTTTSPAQQQEPQDFAGAMFGNAPNASQSEQMRPRVTIDDFTKLRTGSPAHSHIIDAFVTQGGRIFPERIANMFPLIAN